MFSLFTEARKFFPHPEVEEIVLVYYYYRIIFPLSLSSGNYFKLKSECPKSFDLGLNASVANSLTFSEEFFSLGSTFPPECLTNSNKKGFPSPYNRRKCCCLHFIASGLTQSTAGIYLTCFVSWCQSLGQRMDNAVTPQKTARFPSEAADLGPGSLACRTGKAGGV